MAEKVELDAINVTPLTLIVEEVMGSRGNRTGVAAGPMEYPGLAVQPVAPPVDPEYVGHVAHAAAEDPPVVIE